MGPRTCSPRGNRWIFTSGSAYPARRRAISLRWVIRSASIGYGTSDVIGKPKHQLRNENRDDARIDPQSRLRDSERSQNVTPRFELANGDDCIHLRLNSNTFREATVRQSYLKSFGKSGLAAFLARIREKINPSDSTQTITIKVKLIGYSSLRFMTDILDRLFPSNSFNCECQAGWSRDFAGQGDYGGL